MRERIKIWYKDSDTAHTPDENFVCYARKVEPCGLFWFKRKNDDWYININQIKVIHIKPEERSQND